MHAVDLTLYLVLDPDLCGGTQGMIDTTRAAVYNGATIVQLRAPKWKKRAIVECARAIKKMLAESPRTRVPLIIDDHADVCIAADADGLHVGQEDLSPVDARALIGPEKILGLSVNDEEQMAKVDTSLVDYLGVGPIYATSSKLDAAMPLGTAGFAELIARKPCPVVAIGSVKASLADVLIGAGADGLAVISAICGQQNPAEATHDLAEAIKAARAAHAA